MSVAFTPPCFYVCVASDTQLPPDIEVVVKDGYDVRMHVIFNYTMYGMVLFNPVLSHPYTSLYMFEVEGITVYNVRVECLRC